MTDHNRTEADTALSNGMPSALHILNATRELAKEAATRGLLDDMTAIATVRDAQAHLSNAAMPHVGIAIEARLGEIVEQLTEANRIGRAGLALHACISGNLPDHLDRATLVHIKNLVAETVTPAPKSEENQ